MRHYCLLLAIIATCISVKGQEKQIDSVAVSPLSEVIVTGQFEPQSVKKSVFNVKVISSEDIKIWRQQIWAMY